MLQTSIHYGFHFLVPILIALVFFQKHWINVALILLATMAVDIDHLFATPIFDSTRCSIGNHLLHSYWAVALYVLFLFFKKTRIVGIGLVLHMLTDYIDCLWMN